MLWKSFHKIGKKIPDNISVFCYEKLAIKHMFISTIYTKSVWINESTTLVFVKQPLALAGSSNYDFVWQELRQRNKIMSGIEMKWPCGIKIFMYDTAFS